MPQPSASKWDVRLCLCNRHVLVTIVWLTVTLFFLQTVIAVYSVLDAILLSYLTYKVLKLLNVILQYIIKL